MSTPAHAWQPVRPAERYSSLDLLRGFALFGVLIINLLDFFRLSLWEHILHFHSHPGWANHAVDFIAATLIEFKAFNCFAFTFGVGMAIQAERANARGLLPEWFLLRRFLVLLAFGIFHMVLISNVDILMLYAVCGLTLTLLIRLPGPVLAVAGLAAIYLPTLPALNLPFPSGPELQNWANAATQHYGHGSFFDIVAFRWKETRIMIAPLLFGSAQNTAGMMLLGMAAWRASIIRTPERFRRQLWVFAAVVGPIGLANSLHEWLPAIPHIRLIGTYVPLALAYTACLLAARGQSNSDDWTSRFAAAGQMALTNYLTQSIVLGLVFYSYGGGLFGRVAPASAALFAVVFYAAQLSFSQWWLRQYRFGPCEWLWRSATYGHLQPMARHTAAAVAHGQ